MESRAPLCMDAQLQTTRYSMGIPHRKLPRIRPSRLSPNDAQTFMRLLLVIILVSDRPAQSGLCLLHVLLNLLGIVHVAQAGGLFFGLRLGQLGLAWVEGSGIAGQIGEWLGVRSGGENTGEFAGQSVFKIQRAEA